MKKRRGHYPVLYEQICLKYGVEMQVKEVSDQKANLVPRERAMPPSTAETIYQLLQVCQTPMLRPRTVVRSAAKSMASSSVSAPIELTRDSTSAPADIALEFINQTDRISSIQEDLEGLTPTQIMEKDNLEVARAIENNIVVANDVPPSLQETYVSASEASGEVWRSLS